MKSDFISFAKDIAHKIIDSYEDKASERDLKTVNRKARKEGPVKVAFIVQMPEIWDKTEPVYEAMKNDDRFNTQLIVVPHYDIKKKEIRKDYSKNYFLEKYDDAIPGYQNGEWLDLKNEYEYVFFQRPYDGYLPKELRSNNVRRHAKCCYIPYGFAGSDVFNDGNSDKRFFRNISLAFVETEAMSELIRSRFSKKDSIHKIMCLGYPALEPFFQIKPTNEFKRILWTPRWSYDKRLGGSRFLEYKETIKTIKALYPEMEITLRPHPLLFEELESKGLMSKDEVEEYLTSLNDCNIRLDVGRPIYDAISDADILITDYSSIIIQFFVTAKPIIYCEAGIKLNNLFNRMSEGFYNAHEEKDIINYLDSLIQGQDDLASKRYEIIDEDLKKYKNGTKAIIKTIYDDSRNLNQVRID